MRIDKIFSSIGLLSRSECKKAVKAGLIKVGDRTVKSPDEQADPDNDKIYYNGELQNCSSLVYYVLNKPAGVVTARDDKNHETVFKFISDSRPDLSPVGRLDKDTTGILLITNDGQLNHRLLSSKYHVSKTYIIEADGIVGEADIARLEEGIDIGDDKPTLPAMAELISTYGGRSVLSLTITEGRYHQVKRMMAAIGKPVLTLHRQSFGPLTLEDELLPGQARSLTSDEVRLLKEI